MDIIIFISMAIGPNSPVDTTPSQVLAKEEDDDDGGDEKVMNQVLPYIYERFANGHFRSNLAIPLISR